MFRCIYGDAYCNGCGRCSAEINDSNYRGDFDCPDGDEMFDNDGLPDYYGSDADIFDAYKESIGGAE